MGEAMGWRQDAPLGSEIATSSISTCLAALFSSCCCLRPVRVHPDRAEAAAMQLSGELVLAQHVMEMTALTSVRSGDGDVRRRAEEGMAGKAGQGRPWRQNSLILGGSKVDVPLSRSFSVPAQQQAWLVPADGLALPMRGGSERILRNAHSHGSASASMPNAAAWSRSGSGRFDESQPAKTLLEASSRRAARHNLSVGGEGGDSSDVDQSAAVAAFMALYAAAAAARDCKWATAPAVADLFSESAVLVSQDKQMVHGRSAVTARLNRGMELLNKTLGDADAGKSPGVEATQPEHVPGRLRTWLVITTFKRGLMRFRIENEFTLTKDSKISQLKFTRT